MNDRCPNAWFGSHRFEPRYDERANTSYPGGDFTGPGGSFRKLLVLNIIAASVSTGANGKTLIPKIGNYPFPASVAAGKTLIPKIGNYPFPASIAALASCS